MNDRTRDALVKLLTRPDEVDPLPVPVKTKLTVTCCADLIVEGIYDLARHDPQLAMEGLEALIRDMKNNLQKMADTT